MAEQYLGQGAYFIGEFGLIRSTINLYGDNLQIKENFRYSPFVIGLKLSFLYSMKIKEQTRKLAAGCSKHCFEVVDRSDEVSNHTYGKATLTWFEEIFEEY